MLHLLFNLFHEYKNISINIEKLISYHYTKCKWTTNFNSNKNKPSPHYRIIIIFTR